MLNLHKILVFHIFQSDGELLEALCDRGIVPSVFEAILFGGSISLIGFFLDFKDKLSTVNKRELEDMVY